MLTETEVARAKMCINSIEDMLTSIKNEVYNSGYKHKPYLLSKAEPILNDAKVLVEMFTGGDKENV